MAKEFLKPSVLIKSSTSRSSRLDFQPNAAIETRGCNVSQEPLYLEQNWVDLLVDLLGQNNQNITYKTEVVLTIPI